MHRCMLFCAVLLAAVCRPALGGQASEIQPCWPDVETEERMLDGLFRVHLDCEKVLLEIPRNMLGREMLLHTEFAAVSTATDPVAPSQLATSRVVTWWQRGKHVYLEHPTYEIREQRQPGATRPVQASALSELIRRFDVVARGSDGAPVIDVTPLFVRDAPVGFGPELSERLQRDQLDDTRSYIELVKVLPQNIRIRFHQTWTARRDAAGRAASDAGSSAGGALRFVFEANLMLLPAHPMTPRYFDDRVGYFANFVPDFGTDRHGSVQRGFIERYRLRKRDPTATVSEPVEPIVFYIGRDVPQRWRRNLKEAVEMWQGPLEQAGFRNAIRALDAPSPEEDPDWDPDDVRLNVLRWQASGRQNALGAPTIDPRSGEILSSHIAVWHDMMRLAETWYFTQVSPLDPRAHTLPLPDDLMGELLRYVIAHEVGHALGLRHNFKAPAAVTAKQLRDPQWTRRFGTSASIMSYARFNYIAQPGDNVNLIPRLGPYDYFAIDWGYREIPGVTSPDDEWPVLDALAARQVHDPMLRFGGEGELDSIDPSISEQVLGGDAIEAAELGLRNVERVAQLLLPATTVRGEGFETLKEHYDALVVHRHRQLAYVAKLVGGVEEIRYQAGRDGPNFVRVPPERQRSAVQFLAQHAFIAPVALLDPNIVDRLMPTGVQDMLQGSSIDLLRRLIDPGVFKRMAEASEAASGRYLGADLLRDLNRTLFEELQARAPTVGLYRRDLQRSYVVQLLVGSGAIKDPIVANPEFASDADSARGPAPSSRDPASRLDGLARYTRSAEEVPNEFRAALREAMSELSKQIERTLGKVKDPATVLHLRDLLARLAAKK